MKALWLCLRLNHLPLDALHLEQPEAVRHAQPTLAKPKPVAVVDGRRRILLANTSATLAGIQSGMLSTSALAICSQLHCLMRNPRAEKQILHSLAGWALQFSPRIHVATECELVLEVGASLKLFGGLAGLQHRLQQALLAQAYSIQTGWAPTALGAQLLARCHDSEPALDLSNLRQRLNSIPMQAMHWPEKTQQRIAAVGVNTLGECQALPADAFIKRYGAAPRQQLDQLWGHVPDPRDNFIPPAQFTRSLDLLSETDSLDYLRPGFERLLQDLAAQLQGMGCGILCLHASLAHARQPPTRLTLHLQQASRDPQHWMDLLQHRFDRLELPEAVRAIQLRAGEFMPLAHQQSGLWPEADEGKQQPLMEQLAARLGPASLYAVSTWESHCPEQAWRKQDAGQGCNHAAASGYRPMWLLPQPVPIDFACLQQLSQPERLETEWWQGNCQRDYYRALNQYSQQVWVFRDHLKPHRWMLHGLFG